MFYFVLCPLPTSFDNRGEMLCMNMVMLNLTMLQKIGFIRILGMSNYWQQTFSSKAF